MTPWLARLTLKRGRAAKLKKREGRKNLEIMFKVIFHSENKKEKAPEAGGRR